MVMLSIPGVSLTNPFPGWERTRWKGVTTLLCRWLWMSFCIANLSTKDILMFLARFGFGLHICLLILGCFAACSTVAEAPSRCTLLLDLKGWTQVPWHWCKPKRSSNILPDGNTPYPTLLMTLRWWQDMITRLGALPLQHSNGVTYPLLVLGITAG